MTRSTKTGFDSCIFFSLLRRKLFRELTMVSIADRIAYECIQAAAIPILTLRILGARGGDAHDEEQHVIHHQSTKLARRGPSAMTRRPDPRQLLLEWNSVVAPTPEFATTPRPVMNEAVTSSLVLALPWDFRTTFPPVLKEAMNIGVIAEEDACGEKLAVLHTERANALSAVLAELEIIHDARRRRIDPATGKPPRGQAKKKQVPEQLYDELQRLESWYQTLLKTYEAAFGAIAAHAFNKCVRARQSGIEVIAEPPPAVQDVSLPSPNFR